MNFTALLGQISGLFLIGGYIPYILELIKGKTVPNRTSWLIWSLSTILLLWSTHKTGTTEAIWVPVADALGCTIIFLLSIKRGTGGWAKTDLISLGVCVVSIILYFMTENALFILLLNLIIYTSGYIPTIQKSIHHPEEESFSAWSLFMIGVVLNLLTVAFGTDSKNSDLTVWLYPIVLVCTVGTLYFYLLRDKLKRS